jgi:hypothetical protein
MARSLIWTTVVQRLILLLTAISLLVASEARAQAPGATPAEVPLLTTAHADGPLVTRRYGWLILSADVATFALAAGMDSSDVFLIGYLGASPMIHLAHGNPGRAAASVGLRVGLPFVGAMAGLGMANCGPNSGMFCELGAAMLGGMVGMGTAMVVDYVALAKQQHRTVAVDPALIRVGDLRANPTLAASERGVQLGLAGTF